MESGQRWSAMGSDSERSSYCVGFLEGLAVGVMVTVLTFLILHS